MTYARRHAMSGFAVVITTILALIAVWFKRRKEHSNGEQT